MVRLLFLLLFVSCGSIKTKKLKNGITDVPTEKDFFDINYREKYNVENINSVDLNSIYVRIYTLTNENEYINFLGADYKHISFVYALKFYENGCVNQFIISKNDIETDSFLSINPEIEGVRGVCYTQNNINKIAFVTKVSESGKMGIYNPIIELKGDSLFLSENKYLKSVYIKKPLSKKNKKYTANW